MHAKEYNMLYKDKNDTFTTVLGNKSLQYINLRHPSEWYLLPKDNDSSDFAFIISMLFNLNISLKNVFIIVCF